MSLTSLAFGDHQPKIFRSVSAAQDEAFRLLPGLISFDFTDRDYFQFKTFPAQVSGMQLAAVSTPSNRIHFGYRKDPTFVFSYTGIGNFSVEGHSSKCQQQESAVFIPPGYRSEVAGESRSVVVVRLDASRLESTLTTMLGYESERVEIGRFKRPAEVALQPTGVSFDRVFRSLFAQIDAYLKEPSLLDASGIDDAFYRTLILATHRAAFIRQSELRAAPVHIRQLNRVCQYVASEQANRITLTDLERTAHMSRRTLHNAFLKVFGMSPMAWVREQRLLAVRARLQSGRARSVADAFYSCGFTNASLFSATYLRRFGELPSVTLKGAKS